MRIQELYSCNGLERLKDEIANRSSYKRWIRYQMVFFLGMLLGAVIHLMFVGKELDKLHLTIDSLELENGALLDDIKRHEDEQKKSRYSKIPTVEDVVVHILEPKPDTSGFTEAELIKIIERDTKYLEGKQLDTVNELNLAVRQQFKDRTYNVNDKLIQTELRTMTIYTTVHLYIYAKPIPVSP